MTKSATELPLIEGWPYHAIEKEFSTFPFGTPGTVLVGYRLWALLRNVSDAEDFCVCTIPVHLDRSGILEPHEFMLLRKSDPQDGRQSQE